MLEAEFFTQFFVVASRKKNKHFVISGAGENVAQRNTGEDQMTSENFFFFFKHRTHLRCDLVKKKKKKRIKDNIYCLLIWHMLLSKAMYK